MSPGGNTRAEFAVYDCIVFLCEIPAIRNFCTVILRPTFGGLGYCYCCHLFISKFTQESGTVGVDFCEIWGISEV